MVLLSSNISTRGLSCLFTSNTMVQVLQNSSCITINASDQAEWKVGDGRSVPHKDAVIALANVMLLYKYCSSANCAAITTLMQESMCSFWSFLSTFGISSLQWNKLILASISQSYVQRLGINMHQWFCPNYINYPPLMHAFATIDIANKFSYPLQHFCATANEESR